MLRNYDPGHFVGFLLLLTLVLLNIPLIRKLLVEDQIITGGHNATCPLNLAHTGL